MSEIEQEVFVSDLAYRIADRIKHSIRDGRIPSTWDGHELRQLLADKFKHEVSDLMKGKRLKEYKNTVLINNI